MLEGFDVIVKTVVGGVFWYVFLKCWGVFRWEFEEEEGRVFVLPFF